MNLDTTDEWPGLDEAGRSFLSEALGTTPVSVADAGGTAAPDGAAAAALAMAPATVGSDPSFSRLRELLTAATAARASDLHLSSGRCPIVRVDGELRPLGGAPVLSANDLGQIAGSLLSADQRRAFHQTGDVDLGFEADVGGAIRRFRVALFSQTQGPAAAIRIVPESIPSLEALGLPPTLRNLTTLPAGLVLVTGPTGSGKSTTLAALIDEINRQRTLHVLTVEDPIEYRHRDRRSVVNQREIGIDTASFAHAVRHALRQDPDVILIGELRDLETIRIALTAAETGHLVFATLHSADTASAVNRIIDVFPGDQQAQIRSQLALSLMAVVSQRLLPRPQGGRIAMTEVMIATTGVRNLIRESKTHQLPTLLETGAEAGMHTFDQSLTALVRAGLVDVAVARSMASPAMQDRLLS